MGSGLKDCNFMPGIKRFGEEVVKLLMKWLNRRGKRHSLTWGTFKNAGAVSVTGTTDQGQDVPYNREMIM